jgi:hypothetical protein
MSDKTDPIFASGGWVAPAALVYDVESAFDEESDREVAAWPQAIRGGITFSTTFTNGITPEVYRILSGYPFPPPELETLL